MRLALGSSRPADFVGFPTQNGRQNPLDRMDYSSWGNPEALSHDYNRRRVDIRAEPKQSNCELYTDGQLRPSGRRIKSIRRGQAQTRHEVLKRARLHTQMRAKVQGWQCVQHPISTVPRLGNVISKKEHVPSRQQVSEALVCARRNQQHPQLSQDTPR